VQRANDAQPGWAATPYTARAAVLCRAADLLEEHQLEIEDWVVEEAGLPRYFAGALGAAEEFRQAAALASAPLGQVLPFGATSPRNPSLLVINAAARLKRQGRQIRYQLPDLITDSPSRRLCEGEIGWLGRCS
jgi:hypothetical protein